MAGQYGEKKLCWLLWRKGIYKLVMSHVLKTEIFTLTWVHMVTKPHGANHVKLNLSFMVLDTNRSICICLQSPLICFWSNNTQMGHPIRSDKSYFLYTCFSLDYNICRQVIAFSCYADDMLIFLHLKPNQNGLWLPDTCSSSSHTNLCATRGPQKQTCWLFTLFLNLTINNVKFLSLISDYVLRSVFLTFNFIAVFI